MSSYSQCPIFALPGLGTDRRIFDKLGRKIPLYPLDWLPCHRDEDFGTYLEKMMRLLPEKEPVYLMGVSWGGVVAQEIAQRRPHTQLILISSFASPLELPLRLRFMRRLPIYRLAQGSWRVRTLPYWAPIFGVSQPAELALLQDMFTRFRDADRMWCIRQMLAWPGASTAVPMLRLHGTRDRVFPYIRVQGAIPISGGTHFMVYQNAEHIAPVIKEWLRR